MTDEIDETGETDEILERPSDDALVAAWNALGTDPVAPKEVYAEARALVRRVGVRGASDEEYDAAADRILLSLHGRASREPFEFEDATRVRRYLKRCLKNELVRLVDRRREVADEDVGEREDTTPGPGPDEPRPDPAALQPAIDALMTDVVEPCGRRRRAGRLEALREAAGEMVALYLRRATVAEVVGVPDDGPEFKRLRAAMYQRHSRARRELLAYLDHCERLKSVRLDAQAIARHRNLLDTLRRRSRRGQR